MNVIFTCGGTGGHVNPAIAVANIWKERHPDSKILFVGGKGGMEEILVPKAGYELITLPADGLIRSKSLKAMAKNTKILFRLLRVISKCRKSCGILSRMWWSVPAAMPAFRHCLQPAN